MSEVTVAAPPTALLQPEALSANAKTPGHKGKYHHMEEDVFRDEVMDDIYPGAYGRYADKLHADRVYPEELASNQNKRVRQLFPLYEYLRINAEHGINIEDTEPFIAQRFGPAHSIDLDSLGYEILMGQTNGMKQLRFQEKYGTYSPQSLRIPAEYHTKTVPHYKIDPSAMELIKSEQKHGWKEADPSKVPQWNKLRTVHTTGLTDFRGAELRSRGFNEYANPKIRRPMNDPEFADLQPLVPMGRRFKINGVIIPDFPTRQSLRPQQGQGGYNPHNHRFTDGLATTSDIGATGFGDEHPTANPWVSNQSQPLAR